MTVDLTAGLDARFEHFLTRRPADPAMRDAAIMWVFDQSGRIAIPRFSIDAIGEDWDHPVVTLNLVHADGRVIKIWDKFPAHAANGASSLGAGPLAFRCIEPFRRWSFDFDGQAPQLTVAQQMAGGVASHTVPLAFEIEADMAEPPWLMGGLTAEAANQMKAAGSKLMGGHRYEQLCRVKGWIRLSGEDYPVAGTGMRVRRQGVRNMGGAPGHCQHTALFPSGKAFGANVFWPSADGTYPFNEAFVIDAKGKRLAARVAEAPWMHRLEPAGHAARLVLESAGGKVAIDAVTVLKTYDHHYFEMADTSVLEMGVARYSWDGEEALGLFERCTLRERLQT